MKRIITLFVTLLLLSGIFISATSLIFAEENADDLNEKRAKVEELQQKLAEVSQQKVTLASTIELLGTKVKLTQADIAKTQAELNLLTKQLNELNTRITGLDQSLDKLSEVLVARVQEQYRSRQSNTLLLLLNTDGVDEFMAKYKYLQVTQQKTKQLLFQAEGQKISADEQKKLKEAKQQEVQQKRAQLTKQQAVLTQQEKDQKNLLSRAQEDEKKFEEDLRRTLAEMEAIQNIIAGKTEETKVGEIGKGETIATIITGESACSNGTHLHFEVVKDGVNRDPAFFLNSSARVTYTSSSSVDPPIFFRGEWDWPVYDPALITQQWGMSWYARENGYEGAPHTGIDMVSNSPDLRVRSVKSGTLYRGSTMCGGKILRYVRVDHGGNEQTYYLHVNY